jgi:succinyl-CoA synthetase beta subunit
LFKQYGIAVPRGGLAETAPEAADIAEDFGGNVVIKAQVLTGERGKAGAICAVSSVEEARKEAEKILSMSVNGFAVEKVLVVEKLTIQSEFYTAITVDRQAKSVVLMVSAAGGMDIEEIARRQPDALGMFTLADASVIGDRQSLEEWLSGFFPDKKVREQAREIVSQMYRFFREKDCSLVEINPLALTAGGDLQAADAKVVFDDNGLARHPEIMALRNPEEDTEEEQEARAAGLSYIRMDGEIGCVVNGAGLAMATMDGIQLAGGRAANFLDVGGSSNPQKVLAAMRILQKNPRLKSILFNIFGGITRCDDIAKGILMARDELRIPIPVVVRLIGTNEQKGRKMLQEAGITAARRMTEAIKQAVQRAQEVER